PSTWADQTMQFVYSLIGINNGARVVLYEMGNRVPVDPNWSTQNALVDLVNVMSKYGADGGSFWRWVNFLNSEDSDPTIATPIKRRGTAFNYTAVKPILVGLYTPLPPGPVSCTFASRLGDFNGDGDADIFFRRTDGLAAIYFMNGTQIASAGIV